ncbi:lipoyl synthase [Sulfuriferula nivalis]|uniref:Lipoyl synthase n=1 Tax=Sulfuriferula nivalis TaxID=2675298 RepID=A0A809SI66_9PROT|nr:lipoyl synthase [Sulfuriferula nivalis]BBP01480.1 lipoyl synthase [Sulfuriferula nivalis]
MTIIPINVEPTRQPNAVRMPVWIRQNLGQDVHYGKTDAAVHEHRLHTVCEEARCPNRGECWSRGTATFMLLGDTCTRACGFCAVKTGKPDWLDADEPNRVAAAVMELQLRYIVLTSVNRDDLADGGAGIFAETLRQLRLRDGQIGVEFLTPDFRQDQAAAVSTVMTMLNELPDNVRHDLVWGHNVETVPRLYQTARRGSKYVRSLSLLALAAQQSGVAAKSALMLGLGETRDEVLAVLHDLRVAGVSRVSLGQYLRPSLDHLPVISYVHPDEFAEYEEAARAMGFDWVKAGPLVRSSYYAEEIQQQSR